MDKRLLKILTKTEHAYLIYVCGGFHKEEIAEKMDITIEDVIQIRDAVAEKIKQNYGNKKYN